MPIMRSIKMMIEETHSAFKVVATAFNGVVAMDLLTKERPDILFTDIRMPVMNGLELISAVKKEYPDIKLVVISGYQEFEYAREAMRYGVEDYLLKPISPLQIKELLDKLYQEWRLSQEQRLREEVRLSIYRGAASPDAKLPLLNTYSIHQLFLLYVGAFNSLSMDEDNPVGEFWDEIDLHAYVTRLLNVECIISVVDGKSNSEKWVEISFLGTNSNIPDPRLLAEKLFMAWREQVMVTIVYGASYSDFQVTGLKVLMMRTVLYKNIRFGVSQLISLAQHQEPPVTETVLPSHMLRKLEFAVEQKNPEIFKEELQSLISKWKETRPLQVSMERLVKQLFQSCRSALSAATDYSFSILEIDIYKAISYSRSYDELYVYLCKIIDLLFILISGGMRDKSGMNSLMERIDTYLRTHLADAINTQTLSHTFGLVPSYLSKLFTNYKGMSPARYLVYLRIEKAKEMLIEQPEMLFKDIGVMVGYPDPHHFSRVFKKETGMYPSEFKEKGGSEGC